MSVSSSATGFAPGTPFVLIVEDDVPLAQTLRRQVADLVDVRVAHRIADARAWLGSHATLAAVLLDLVLPDGDGLDVLRELRSTRPTLPVLVLSGADDWPLVNRAAEQGARYVSKRDDLERLRFLLRDFISKALRDSDGAASRVRGLCTSAGLTPRQSELLWLFVQGCPRDKLAAQLGVSENTVKTHIRDLLTKCGAKSLEDVCRRLFQESIAESSTRIA